ncbi:hypothetical protein FRC02_010883 [Tulasnella sp. 418]|nr:hypothetical protein FRC02_010883 [Tulasnella sp. 418]
MASVHPPQPTSAVPLQARRPSLRHRLSNNGRSPPVPPSLVDSPYLQSPNSPFNKRKPHSGPEDFHDSLGLYDTVPMGAPPQEYMDHRRNSVGLTNGPPGPSQRYSGGASVGSYPAGSTSLRSDGMTHSGSVPTSLTPSSSSQASQQRSSAMLGPGVAISRPASFTNVHQPPSSSRSASTLPHQAAYPHHHNLPPPNSHSTSQQATQQQSRR